MARRSAALVAFVLAVAVLAVLLLPSIAAAQGRAQGVSYVSPRGNDRWSGRSPEPSADGRDGPFASVQRALKAAHDGGARTILLRGGLYTLKETLQLDEDDNGVRIGAFPGEVPVFTGGERVEGVRAEAGGVFSAPLAAEPGLDITVNGRRLRAAQSGDLDPEQPERTGWLFAQGVKGGGDKRRFRFTPGTVLPAWNAPGVRVQVLDRERLADDIAGVQQIDAARNTLTLERDGWYPFRDGTTFRLLGHPDFLKFPGQFAWRAKDKRLLFMPVEGDDFGADDDVVVARLSPLVRIKDAQGITLEGLAFEDTPYNGPALRIEGGGRHRILGNRFTNVGMAVEVSASSNNEIRQNRMESLGRTGIDLKAGSHANRVIANTMRNLGEVSFFGAGVFVAGGDGNRIAHNDIRHASRYGISLKNWSPETVNTDTVVEYNRIYDVGRVTADGGAIESLGRSNIDTRTVIRFNDIRHTGGLATDAAGRWLERYKGFGIYLDDQTNGVTVEGNFLMDTGWAAVFIHGGDGNRVHNNISVLTQPRDRFLRLEWVPKAGIAGFLKDNAATRNLIHLRAPVKDIVEAHTGGEALIEQNIIDRPGRHGAVRTPVQARSQQGPRVTNPYFMDPDTQDFRLRPDSPALEQGIADLPWQRIGPEGFRER